MVRIDGGIGIDNTDNTNRNIVQPETERPPEVCTDDRFGADSRFGFLSLTESIFKLRANVAAPQTPPAAPTVDQGRIDEGVNQVFQAAGSGYGNATVELANQLRGQSDEYQAQFIKTLYEKTGPGFTDQVLRTAGGEIPHHISDARPSEDDQRVIATALGKAYDRGALNSDFVAKILQWESQLLPPRNDYSGRLVAKSGSRELMRAYADQALALYANKSWETESFNSGAAFALAGDPELLQEKLAQLKRDGGLEDFIKNLDPAKFNVPYYESYDNALSHIITTAARIQPPTPEVLDLFRTVANNLMEAKGVPESMTKLYTGGYTETLRWPNGKVEDTIFHSNAEF
ncbi:MAG TPA: hypothetical protein VM870_05415, partial [Pyrinomonadaceae bacterium]|nr:hypothetical protein [Pyrinomonadaceae bacterium]